jgi:mannitol-specific phosphotransferase system IIBC component
VGFVTAIMSIVDGWATIQDAISKTTKDWWMVASGGLQIASGVVIIIAVCLSSPGGQIIGAVIGIVAGAVAVIDDLVTDPMVVFLREMLEKIRGAKSNWDQSSMVKNVGVDTLVDDFDHLIDSTKVTGILYDHDWTSGGSKVGLDRVTDALNDLGVSDGLLRRKLIRIA